MKVKLGEICDIKAGGTPARSIPAYWENGDIPWVKIGDMQGKFLKSTSECITPDGLKSSSAKLFTKGTLLLSIFATIGEVSILDIDACTNQAVAGLALKSPCLTSDYLYYFLLSQKEYLVFLSRGVAQNNINLSILRSMELDIPSLARQREIVRVLDKVEAVIDKHKRQLAKLDELTKARFVEMFGSTVANEKKWSTQKIETVAPAQCATQKQQTTVWLLNLDAVESHTGRILEYQYVDYTRVGPSTCCFDEKNVLYSKLRPYLNKVVLPDRPGMATSELVPLRPNDQVNRVFLAHMLRSDEFVAYIKEKVSGAKMPRVQMDEFRKFPMIIPPLPLQRQFAEFVTHIERMKGKVRASLEATQKLLGSLMQEYFS